MKKDYRKNRWILAYAFSKVEFAKCMSGLLLLLCFFQHPQAHARDTIGNTVISLSVDNEPIRNVFNLVEHQTGLTFFYLDKQVDVDRPVTLTVSNVALDKALTLLFANTTITYRISGKQIVLKKAAEKIGKLKVDTSPLIETEMLTAQTVAQISMPVVNASPAAITVGGIVTSDTGETLPGVNVVEKGTTNGTTTDVDGRYNLSISDESSVLVFSFIGFSPQEIVVGARTNVDVKLVTDIQSLEEVVVIGYGTQEKRTLTGSVESISTKQITQAKTLNFVDAMQGRAAGVNVQSTSGTPGAPTNITIRGVNSINSDTDPLWVIDGMPVFTEAIEQSKGFTGSKGSLKQNPLASINPNDIQSIEVLKDAAATAIYGSRGSNGVIIVTTKSGKNSKGGVTVDYTTGVSQFSKSIADAGLANTQQWVAIVDQARASRNLGEWAPSLPAAYQTAISRADALATQSDWGALALQNGNFNDVNVSFSQGSEKASLFTSLNYRKDKGVNLGNELSRLSGRINLELTPVKGLKFGTRLNISYIENYRTKDAKSNPGTSGGSVGGFAAIAQQALPWYPIYDDNDPSGYWNPSAGNVALANRRDLLLDKKEQYTALGTVYAEYDFPFLKGLSVRGEGAFNMIQDNGTNWASPSVTNNRQSFAYEGAITASSINYNALLKYSKDFGLHRINAVFGTESQRKSNYIREIEGNNLVGYNQQIGSTSPGTITSVSGYRDDERYLRSYFARADYEFSSRYLLGASVRRDGSSAFDENGRWGTFYALSAGWILSEEKFFSPLANTISFMKLRASYGETGNQSIPNNQNITILENKLDAKYGPKTPAGTKYNVGNQVLTWETTNSYNAGVDVRFLKDRISASAEYYIQKVSGMLLKVKAPPSAAINEVYSNAGDMDNYGWEFTVSSLNIQKGDFEWTTSLNFSTNRNRVNQLTPLLEQQKGNELYVGGRLGLYKMGNYAGIDPERGVHMIHEFNRGLFDETGEVVYTGRIIPFTESNSQNQQVVFADKSRYPTYFGGINNTFTYKGFDLGIFFNFSGGNWIYNDYARNTTNVANAYWNLKADLLTDSWVPGKTDANYPLLFIEGNAPNTTVWDPKAIDPNTQLLGWWKSPDDIDYASAKETYDKNGGVRLSKNLERGDYLRLKTISLGYTFRGEWLSTKYIQNLRLYVTANNLWTLTGYTGWDPESGSTLDPNNPIATTPVTKNFMAGLSVTF